MDLKNNFFLLWVVGAFLLFAYELHLLRESGGRGGDREGSGSNFVDSKRNGVDDDDSDLVTTKMSELVEFAKHFNNVSPWRNSERFRLDYDFVAVVVRVNRRREHLRRLLSSLERVVGINRTVLIVSHDSLDAAVMRQVSSIDFMVVKQVSEKRGFVLL